MYDDAQPSADLQSHLADCGTCRRMLETWPELAGSLRAALEPETLTDELARSIRERLDAQTVARRPAWLVPLSVACTAAAACLVVAILVGWPGRNRPVANTQPGEERIELSDADTALIVAACMRWGWDSPADYLVDVVAEQVEHVARGMQQQEDAGGLLPWGPEDDWDLPPANSGASGRRPTGRLCADLLTRA
jgi:anti-sigma factor RsiW